MMDSPPSAWLYDPPRYSWRHYTHPIATLTAHRLPDLLPMLAEIEQTVQSRSLHAVGFLSYDSAPAFDPSLQVQRHPQFPLASFTLFPNPTLTSLPPPPQLSTLTPPLWTPSLTRESYNHAIAAIRNAIAAGLAYQVNFTFRLRARLTDDPWLWFLRLIHAQPQGYGAFLTLNDWTIGSASPELFLELNGARLITKPMKGTAPRGLWSARDAQFARELRTHPKTRAENVMIVDMARNDLGRIAEVGSVRVTRLFEVERLPTVLQMTSTIEAKTHAPLPSIFQSLFPAASITGAPKSSTMKLIAELEDSPRGLYTGAIGVIEPNRQVRFNVAIRTLIVHRKTGQAEYGTGGGIVWDSLDRAEYEESLSKASILHADPLPPFELLETMRWTPTEDYFLLEGHLERLAASARYFRFSLSLANLRHFLAQKAASFPPRPQRVRLRLSPDGQFTLDHQDIQPLPNRRPLGWARRPINPNDPLLYHKTTYRKLYEKSLQEVPGAPDILLWNPQGELTESTIANLFLEIKGRLMTPPIACGLLPGVLRAELLRTGQAHEQIVRPADLSRASRVFLGNSVRGLWPITPPAGPAPVP